jgi:hypothetical protein
MSCLEYRIIIYFQEFRAVAVPPGSVYSKFKLKKHKCVANINSLLCLDIAANTYSEGNEKIDKQNEV